jgi:uncharacterized OB-fold protein
MAKHVDRVGKDGIRRRYELVKTERLVGHLCEHCGELFTPARSDARFCSDGCRIKAHREKQRGN